MSDTSGYEIAPEGTTDYFYKVVNGTDHEGVFMFAKLDRPGNFMQATDRDRRCDFYNKLAPRGFHLWDDVAKRCTCGSDQRPDSLTAAHFELSDLYCLYAVVEAAPYGVICYCEFHDDDKEVEQLEGALNTYTRTIQEQLRYMAEWHYVATNFGNTEEVALTAQAMINALEIPDDLYNWLLESVPPEKVGRYLQGHPNARARTSEPIADLTVPFWSWLRDKIDACRSFGGYDS